MMNAVKKFLEDKGYENIFIDYHPEVPQTPEMIALYCWECRPDTIFDGTVTNYIQVRVRRYSLEEAMSACTAIVTLLDSGPGETPIPLYHPGTVIGRVRRLPITLERVDDTVTVYSEIALWGIN